MEIALGQHRPDQAFIREAGDHRIGLPPLRCPLQGEDPLIAGGISLRERLRDGNLELDLLGGRGKRGGGDRLYLTAARRLPSQGELYPISRSNNGDSARIRRPAGTMTLSA